MLSTLEEANKSVVRRFNKEFVEDGNAAVFEELVSADFCNHEAPPGETGRDPARFFFLQMFRTAFPDVKVNIHDMYADGDAVITRKSYVGTHAAPFMNFPPSGKKVEIPVIEIVTIRDGKYVDHWAVTNFFALMQ